MNHERGVGAFTGGLRTTRSRVRVRMCESEYGAVLPTLASLLHNPPSTEAS